MKVCQNLFFFKIGNKFVFYSWPTTQRTTNEKLANYASGWINRNEKLIHNKDRYSIIASCACFRDHITEGVFSLGEFT